MEHSLETAEALRGVDWKEVMETRGQFVHVSLKAS